MSTYNGERYLGEQLQSIYAQKEVNVSVLVRDDGSTDTTHTLLDKEQAAGKLTWYTGPNLRPARSFWHLLKTAAEADFYAFSDQDDFWLPDKLSAAVAMLGEPDCPSLYFSQTQLADENLNPLPNVQLRPLLTYEEALAYIFVGGSTMVISRAMREILLRYEPGYMQMHDFWVYDVAQAVGAKVVFDPVPHVLYRQHGGNVIGLSAGFSYRWRNRLKRWFSREHIRLRTAEELLAGYADMMPEAHLALTQRVAACRHSLRARLYMAFVRPLRTARAGVSLSTRFAFLFNLF